MCIYIEFTFGENSRWPPQLIECGTHINGYDFVSFIAI